MPRKGANLLAGLNSRIILGTTPEGKTFDLPGAESVTQTFALLAKRGAGKTYTAKGLAEGMLRCAYQIGILDPVGVWWGLRLDKDGKRPGFDIPVLGGDHADAALPFDKGEQIAEWMVSTGTSAILDLSLMRKGEMNTFVGQFADTLYRLKASNRSPLHLFIDEADAFAPQNPSRNEDKGKWRPQMTLGAVESLVRRGRARGIGATLITQRSAVVNKDVLTQTEVLIAMRTVSPQDQAAIKLWVDAHDVDNRRQEMMESLASLPIGTGWVWGPGWLDIFQRVEFNVIKTYDSSATPDANTVDVGIIPVRKFEALELLNEKLAPPKPKTAAKPRVLEVPIKLPPDTRLQDSERWRAAQGKLIRSTRTRVDKLIQTLYSVLKEAEAIRAELDGQAEPPKFQATFQHGEPSRAAEALGATAPLQPKTAVEGAIPTSPTSPLAGPHAKFLEAISTFNALGIESPDKALVAVFAGYKPGSGTVDTYYSRMRKDGLLEYDNAGGVSLTNLGVDMAPAIARPATVSELHAKWFALIKGTERKFVDVLIRHYPAAVHKDDLATEAGYSPGSGTTDTYISRVKRLGLAVQPQAGYLKASSLLFPEGLQ